MADKFDLSKGEEYLLKAASIGAAILGIIAVHGFYKNNIWKPTIKVNSVDYANVVAYLQINGKPFVLRGDSSYLISYDWGIRFGFTSKGNTTYADRIEVLKRNNVQDVIASQNPSYLTAGSSHDSEGKSGLASILDFLTKKS